MQPKTTNITTSPFPSCVARASPEQNFAPALFLCTKPQTELFAARIPAFFLTASHRDDIDGWRCISLRQRAAHPRVEKSGRPHLSAFQEETNEMDESLSRDAPCCDHNDVWLQKD
jgi:hypothetical protein